MLKILLFCIVIGTAFAVPLKVPDVHPVVTTSSDPWQEFSYAAELDVLGKYWMFWTPDDETKIITFEVHVEALGYVGFGISPNGGMTGADVVIGWVTDDGTPFFHDRHALGEYEPVIDDSQDVTLLAYSQNDTHTILRFSRPYVTCDEDDMDITDDTMRVIFSFTDTDPEDITGLQYHGSTNRGTKSVVLLYYNDLGHTLPDDTVTMDILVTEHTVPQRETTYWCEFIKVDQLEQKHHVVMFEPVVQPGNEGIVHHIVLYTCIGEMDDSNEGQTWDCAWSVMPDQTKCYTATFVWAVGGNPFYFPEHAGIPFFASGNNEPMFMRLEVHYDNPNHIAGVRDHSGLRLHMTPTLRENDVGLMLVGASVTPGMMIPPHYNDLTYRGYCTPPCMEAAFNTTGIDQINVFAIFHHAHLLGRKMKTRIYRDGAELEPLLDDGNYDFDFQETRKIREERIIYPTDTLVLDCGYDSTERDSLTVGGLSTRDEMCESFLYYYPAHDVLTCDSFPAHYHSIQIVEDITTEPSPQYPYFRITGPPEYAGMTTLEVFETLDWTDETLRQRYQDLLLEENSLMEQSCFSVEGTVLLPTGQHTPDLPDDWVDPDDGQCNEAK